MKKSVVDKYISEAHIPDDENPDYMFQGVNIKLLLKIANGKLDAKKLAREALVDRGLGKSGSWVGFDKAKEVWK